MKSKNYNKNAFSINTNYNVKMEFIKKLLIVLLISFALFVMYHGFFPYDSPVWMGFNIKNPVKIKTLWDWLDLLIVPASLIIIGWIYKDYEKKKEEKKDRENKYNETLDSYFKIISDLITKDNLLDKLKNANSKIIGRTRTIVAIENLDGERKGQILQFLYESKLIDDDILDIIGANFQNVEVSGIVLRNLTIKGVYFCNSIFENTFL